MSFTVLSSILAEPTYQVALTSFLVFVLLSLRQVRGLLQERKAYTPSNERVYSIIASIAVGNPRYRITQEEALATALKCPRLETVRPMLKRLYGNTCIANRYFCVPDFNSDKKRTGNDPMFYPTDGSYEVPIDVRLDKFTEEAVPLVTDVARRAIKEAGIGVTEIDKLVVASSTGLLSPGLDHELINNLGLMRSVDRTLVGFMGCAAAINSFRVANAFLEANPGKNALVICIELPSLHTTYEDSMNGAVMHAIFGDGCAAAVLQGVREVDCPKGAIAAVDNHAWLMEGTKDGITLSIKNNGITSRLSKLLPKYIANNLSPFVNHFLAKNNLRKSDLDFWCVHPGGPSILQEATNALSLTTEQLADSWAVLNDYGNMLSPSVMFVLERVLKRHRTALAQGQRGCKLGMAISFSPGVGVEGILLKQI